MRVKTKVEIYDDDIGQSKVHRTTKGPFSTHHEDTDFDENDLPDDANFYKEFWRRFFKDEV